MGKPLLERKPTEKFDWKKIELDFTENRKKANPMVNSENALSKINVAPYFCGKELQSKISSCSFYSCLYRMDVMGEKLASDIIVYGTNGAGLCAISGPVGKRYFVAKEDLGFFYEVLTALSSASEVTSNAPLILDSTQTQKIKNTVQLSGSTCVIHLETKKEQLTNAALEATAPSVCKDKKVDLLYQLELKKLSLHFTPIKMGFPKDDF